MRDATSDPDDAALVMAIITLAHNLRLKVIAEGVETEDQLRFLPVAALRRNTGLLLQQTPTRRDICLIFEPQMNADYTDQKKQSV